MQKIEDGISLRDWFAGVSLNGILVAPGEISSKERVAEFCWEMADEMLKEREGSR